MSWPSPPAETLTSAPPGESCGSRPVAGGWTQSFGLYTHTQIFLLPVLFSLISLVLMLQNIDLYEGSGDNTVYSSDMTFVGKVIMSMEMCKHQPATSKGDWLKKSKH